MVEAEAWTSRHKWTCSDFLPIRASSSEGCANSSKSFSTASLQTKKWHLGLSYSHSYRRFPQALALAELHRPRSLCPKKRDGSSRMPRFVPPRFYALSIATNRLLSASASVGCAKMPSRSAVYGSLPIIAISKAAMVSPPSMPKTAAPRIC